MVIKNIFTKFFEKKYFQIRNKLRYVPPDERINFNMNTINDGHIQVTYRGVPTIKCPFDYVMYQMILHEIKPDLVIEIGSSNGGNALYMADIMNVIGKGVVHTIDIKRPSAELVINHPRIKIFDKGWTGYDVSNSRGFSKILVIDDASHSYEDVLGSLKKFSPLVSLGSYFIVEDGIISSFGRNKGFNGGPLRAIREFLMGTEDFKVDRRYCDLFGKNATFNVNGYLKKTK